MALLALSSLYRHTSLHIQSPLSSVLQKGLRSTSSFITLSGSPELPTNGAEEKSGGTPEVPEVTNLAKETKSKEEVWAKKSKRAMTELSGLPMVNPYSGRSITVRRDLGDSLRQLDGILSRNKVKLQLRMTERHEKKGYKRRRLESERWRKQFANEVRKKVQLVMKMRDRGA